MSDYSEVNTPNFAEVIIQSNLQNFEFLLKSFCDEQLTSFAFMGVGDVGPGKRYAYWARGIRAEVEAIPINESALRIRFAQDIFLDDPQKYFARVLGRWLTIYFQTSEKNLLSSITQLEERLKQLGSGQKSAMLPEQNKAQKKVLGVHLSEFSTEIKNASDAPFSATTEREQQGEFVVIKHKLGIGNENSLTWGAGYAQKSIFPTSKETLTYHARNILAHAQKKYRYVKIRMGNGEYCYVGFLPIIEKADSLSTKIKIEWISSTTCDDYGNPVFEYFHNDDGLCFELFASNAFVAVIEPIHEKECVITTRSYLEAATPIFDYLWSELRKLFCKDCLPDSAQLHPPPTIPADDVVLATDPNTKPIHAHKLKDRREKVREMRLAGRYSYKEIAAEINESEDVVKKDVAWLIESKYMTT